MNTVTPASVRVLHITETFSSGVATAVHSFVENSPQVQHHLLASVRDGAGVSMSERSRFESITDLPRGLRAACSTILREYRRLQPDLVHVHCAYAGVYVRILAIPRERIIYSPHCFPFERLADPWPARAAYAAVEAVLALRTGAFAAVSRSEAGLCRRFPGRARVVEIPNVSHLRHRPRPAGQPHNTWPVVAFNGRLSPQKDPMFVVEALRRAPELVSKIDFVWIGHGDAPLVRALESVGVRVTGWLSLDGVQAELRASDLYVHTARWEGFPMSVLEAAALDVPVVARRIAAFEGYDFAPEALFEDTAGFDALMRRLIDDREQVLVHGRRLSGQVRNGFQAEHQARALAALYTVEGARAAHRLPGRAQTT